MEFDYGLFSSSPSGLLGLGAMVFDSNGRPMVALQGFHSAFSSVLIAEAQAILEGLRIGAKNGVSID